MIHQLSELGCYFLDRQGVDDPLEQISQDPSAKFGSTALVLVFNESGFLRVEAEGYEEARRVDFLYRAGPPNLWDATPTTGMPQPNAEKGPNGFLADLHTRIARLGNSVRDALAQGEKLPAIEIRELEVISAAVPDKNGKGESRGAELRSCIIEALQEAHPDPKQRAFISIAWRKADGNLKYVGGFEAFRQQLLRAGSEAASRSQGIGQCSICGRSGVPVLGNLQVPNFKFYTLDKRGSISGGFDENKAWRNFPVCRECCAEVDFAGEWVKKELSFKYYGFSYLLLPSPVQPAKTRSFEMLRKLIDAKVDNRRGPKLTDAEDELLAVIAEEENNRLQVDLLFYQPDPQSFRPALYVSGLLPTRFCELFKAKEAVDHHSWLKAPSPKPFTEGSFTFGSLRKVFPSKVGGSSYDDDFLGATRAALEKRYFDPARLLNVGMRLVQQDLLDGKAWAFRLAELVRSLLFFELLISKSAPPLNQTMAKPDYGTSLQAERVRALFDTAPGLLNSDAVAQAVFLLGACCARIENIQLRLTKATPFSGSKAAPFSGKLKAFRLNQPDIQRLFVDAKEKSQAYGPDQERRVSGLLSCTAAALAACPDQWPLSPDEISYYFALGHALRSRLADAGSKDDENETIQPSAT